VSGCATRVLDFAWVVCTSLRRLVPPLQRSNTCCCAACHAAARYAISKFVIRQVSHRFSRIPQPIVRLTLESDRESEDLPRGVPATHSTPEVSRLAMHTIKDIHHGPGLGLDVGRCRSASTRWKACQSGGRPVSASGSATWEQGARDTRHGFAACSAAKRLSTDGCIDVGTQSTSTAVQ
jgi:hypothetical protein